MNRSCSRPPAGVLVAVAIVAAYAPSPASACSICRCGDAAFNALGTDIYAPGAFRLALDWDHFDKTQGPPGASESQIQNGVTLTTSYTFGESANLVARVPYSFKSLTTTAGGVSDVTDTHGFADPEFFAWIRLWASDLSPGLGRRSWLSAQFGVKTSWGEDDLTGPDGERLDQHAQPGTGSTDVFAGLGGLTLLDARSTLFGSVQYRWTGTNTYGYRYGRIFLANLGYDRKLGSAVDAVLELNYRWAGKDTVDASGVQDPDTGGALLYVTPRVLVSLGRGIVARAAVLIPTFQNLNGYQTERPVLSAGVTYQF
jgi:hypothetical protein